MSRTIKTISKIKPTIDSSQTNEFRLNLQKKAGVVEHPRVSDHAGLLFNEPPAKTGLPFI
jgi:hypothetical protein